MPPTTKILVLAANPWDTKRLGLDEEYREICAVWEKGQDENKFELKQVPAARSEDLLDKLQAFKPNIVHFSGHGELDNLLFSDDVGNTHKINQTLLTEIFALCTEHVDCVFLNACNTEQIAHAISQQIAYAIGMNAEINDLAAVIFAKGFYRALFNGKDIKTAYQFALLELKLKGFNNQQDIPVLYDQQTIAASIQTPKAFLSNYQYDILIHAASSDKNWAEQFKNELQKYLTQKLNSQSCYLHLQTDNNPHLEQAAVNLFILSADYINEYQSILPQLVKPSQKQFLISRSSEACPNELSGLSSYQFYSEQMDFSNSAEFQELATTISQYLQNLRKESEFKKTSNPFSEPLVFIHTEPSAAEVDLVKHLKPLFKTKGLACAIANPNFYKQDVKESQKSCHGVLIVYGTDYLWARGRIDEYHRLKQRRKEPLKMVMIHADCSQQMKDTEGLDIYDSVPVFAYPPQDLEELIKRFAEALI